ncbi:CRTAC1 family protein [Nocardia sp. NRRL S-836]|uniref:CRTAC1 family protein n=1 Tax=Nocardia sp. NRRL S-836 TaxID=1519492 RepID=UPI0006AEE206|nr:CRTAC1 family protein [Nocardia sp. NRRL S-836]KOV86328.1 alpha integrin [Nocardia sp. NRRL S-836]
MGQLGRRMAAASVAIALCVGTGVLVARPTLSEQDASALAARYAFSTVSLNEAPADAKYVRRVAPALDRISGWISSVGAAVTLADLRGLGRSADACLVDPRDDSVRLIAVPGSGGPSYPPTELRPRGLPYDDTMAPMGCTPADVDEDGDVDFLVYYWGRTPVVFLNTGGDAPGSFRAAELVEPVEVWNSTGLNVADVDGDGHLDLLVANYFPDGARVLDPQARDDTRMAMQHSMALAGNGGVNRLLLTHPSGAADAVPGLTDQTIALPDDVARAWTLATGMQDLTGDGLPEIYLANDFGPDHLLVNTSTPGVVRLRAVRGGRDLVTPKSEVLGRDSFKGMGVTFSYADRGPLPMMVVSNITSPFALQESNFAFTPHGSGADLLHGEVPFRDRGEELGLSRSGWSWDVKAGDFDDDGTDELVQAVGFLRGERNRWPELQELAMGNDDLLRHPEVWPRFQPGDDLSGHERNRFWARGPDGRYADLAARLGVGGDSVSRGIALGDVDGDGKLDALVANQWANSVLLHNETARSGPAATLRLVVPAGGGTRAAVGAQVTTGAAKAQLYPANGHVGVSAAELHLALTDRTDTAEVRWRDAAGVHQATVGVRAGHQTLLLRPDGTVVTR